jgi:hypothetical protein
VLDDFLHFWHFWQSLGVMALLEQACGAAILHEMVPFVQYGVAGVIALIPSFA